MKTTKYMVSYHSKIENGWGFGNFEATIKGDLTMDKIRELEKQALEPNDLGLKSFQ